MKALREYKQGCLLFVLPDYLRRAIVDWTLENIPDFHLADGGRELRPHITVVYGFDDDVGEQVKQFLQDTKPFSVRLTGLGVFPEGKDGVPFFVRVESPELQRLHYSVLEAFGVEDKHPNYQPHITLGYLRPEVAESYLKGKPPFLPSMVTLDQLEFSTAEKHVTSIPLSVLPLLGQKSMRHEIKSQGEPCKQGEAASRTGCIPASPSTGQQGTAKKPPQKASGNAKLKEAVRGYNRALAILKRSEPDSPGYRKLKDDVARAAQKLVSERNKAKEPVREEPAETPNKKKTLRERAAQMRERYRKIKEKVKEGGKEGGKKAVEKAGKATVATQSFFRNLSEKYLGKVGTEVAEAVIGAAQETINTILLGEDELPEDPAGWGVNIATNLIPDMVAWAWRIGRKWATGVDPRDVKYPRKSLPEGIDLDGIADMLLELQSQYEKDGLDFEPLDKDGILELLQRNLQEQPGTRGEKSFPYFIKMEEHRDRGGRRYCTEEGVGIVPCGEQRTTEEGDTPGTKPSPAPVGDAPRKLGGESSRSYQQEAQRSQRREERKEQRKQERSQLPSIKEVRQEALDELHEHSPEEQKQIKKRMIVDLKKVIEAASKKVRDTRNKVAAGVDMVKDVSKELAKKVGEKAGLDEQQTEELTKKFGSEAKERFDDLLKKGDLPDDINDIFTLKSVIRWAPEIVRILYRQARIALTGVDPRTVPSKHVRRQQEQERRQEMKRQQRRKKRDERRKHKAERSSGRKSLSWLAADRGGALVPPPATGKKVPMNRSKIAGRKLLLPVNRVKTWEDCNAERFGVFLSSLKSHPLPRYPEDEDANQVGFALSEARGQLAAILAQYGRNDVMGLRNVLDPKAWHRVEMALDEVRRLEREYADLRERNILMRGEPHRQKSLPYEDKGLVEKKDRIGRRMCYDDQTGKRVPCPKKDGAKKEKPQTKPTWESVNTGDTSPKEKTPVNEYLKDREQKVEKPPTADEYVDWTENLSMSDIRAVESTISQYHAGDLTFDQAVAEIVNNVYGTEPAMARERLLWADADRNDAPIQREPTPEEVRAVHNPETGRESARRALDHISERKIQIGERLSEEDIEDSAKKVHDAWMQREASLPGGGRASRRHLMVPYEQLSEADKEKDREFVREVVASMRPEKYWGSKEQPFYRPGPNPTVDNVVMRDGESGPEVLLIRRKDGTAEGGKWALPGGFIDSDSKKGEPFKPGKETPEQAALRELTEESGLGLQSIQDQVKKVGTFNTRGRDPRDNAEAWAVSDAFSVKLPKDMANAYVEGRDDADRAEWVPVSELKNRELAFDHASILNASGVDTPPEPGFTGTDRLGREWRDGELVAKQDESPTDSQTQESPPVTRARSNSNVSEDLTNAQPLDNQQAWKLKNYASELVAQGLDDDPEYREAVAEELRRIGAELRDGEWILKVRLGGNDVNGMPQDEVIQHTLNPFFPDRGFQQWTDTSTPEYREKPFPGESPTDEEGYSQIDDVTGKRRTPEEQQQYRRDIQEMNRQPREVAKEAISGWDSFSPEERNSLRDVIDRHLEAIARNRKEEEVGRELTDDEVDDIKTDVFRQGLSRGRRDTQKLIRMIADPTQSGSTASEFKAALRKIRDSRAGTQQQEPSKETPKPKVKPSPFMGRKNPASRKAASETGATEVRRDYDAIKADLRNITVDDMRSRFSDAVAGRSKEELSRALESLGHNTAGLSRQRIVDHLLDNLTSIKISLDQTEQIRNSPR